MISFITSLRNPLNCNFDFSSRVLPLLEHTLASVCNQTVRDFNVIVVCNLGSQPEFKSPKVEYVKVDFPPPSKLKTSKTGMEAIRLDRGCKYVVGLLHARKYRPDHIMFFDADDFISNRIAEFCARHPEHNGWYIKRGYVYHRASGSLGRLDDFHMICGTSHIINYSSFSLPRDLRVDSHQEQILSSVDHHYLFKIIGSHRWFVEHFVRNGYPLKPLPFRGAVYHVGHGENHNPYAENLRSLKTRLTNRIRAEFKLYPDVPYLRGDSSFESHT